MPWGTRIPASGFSTPIRRSPDTRADACLAPYRVLYDGHPIETHGVEAFLNVNFQDRTCVLLSPTGTDRGNVCYFGFPLYYLQTAQVKAVFDKLLPLFGEERL